MASGKVRFGLVDSLRALAALSIVGYHIGFFAGAGRTGFTAAVSSQLIAGLALFFVISGFVLSWYIIERPALSLSRLVPARRRPAPVEQAEVSSAAVAP